MAPPRKITLSDGKAEVDILPQQGAAVGRYLFLAGEHPHPIFAPTSFGHGAQAFDVGSILLVPWSNRIGGGGFHYEGRFVPLDSNLDGEPFPIHGNAFQCAWEIISQAAISVALQLESDGPGEFRYRSQVSYALSDGCLSISLAVTNHATRPLPFGLGFHPWLPRTPDTVLQFHAEDVWLEDDRHLPVGRRPLADQPEWNFSRLRPLPAGWINNAFGGWDGSAELYWPERRLSVGIEASEELSVCMLYSPGEAASFLCFEPVSHAVDAHNLPAEDNLLRRLVPGATMRASCRFAPRQIRDGDLQ